MDDIKDVSKRDRLPGFLLSRTLRTQPLGSNVSADRAYRRAERLAAAIHLITNHVSADEPARRFSRRTVFGLLSSILLLRDDMRSPESGAFKEAQALIRKLISSIRILAVAGHVSLQNADVLVEALDELGNLLLSSQRTTLSESVVFGKEEFLEVGYPPSSLKRISDTAATGQPRPSIKDRLRGKNKMSDRGDRTKGRAEGIVGVLGAQGRLGIKDIAASLPEYSEKMIQRQLRSLVALGRIKKVGSKRWSTYTLA